MTPKQGPDFLCIGAQKAATTWLHANLSTHPQVWLPFCKELDYFKFPNQDVPNQVPYTVLNYRIQAFYREFNLMMQQKRVNFSVLQWYGQKLTQTYQDDAWYLSLYDGLEDRVRGDISPSYATLDEAQVKHARDVLGEETKIIYILREPIARSWSQICQSISHKYIEAPQTMEAMKACVDIGYINDNAQYARTVALWSKYFPKIKLMYLDDIKAQPQESLQEVCAFLGIEMKGDSFTRFGDKIVNESKKAAIPPEVESYMAKKYKPMLESLQESLSNDNPVAAWLEKAEGILSNSGQN